MLVMVRAIAIISVVACMTGSALAETKMLKGPYLQDLAPESITVMWQLETAKAAKLTVTGPGGEKVQTIDPTRIGEAKVEGLSPSSRYRYRVEIESTSWEGEFATAPPIGKDV